jgi:hypothetical protein
MPKMYCVDCRTVPDPEAVCYYEDDRGMHLAYYWDFVNLPEEYDWHCTDCGAFIDPPWMRMVREARQCLSAMGDAERRQSLTTHDLTLMSLHMILASDIDLYCHHCRYANLDEYEFGRVEWQGGDIDLRAGDPITVVIMSRRWPWICSSCMDPIYVPQQTAMAAVKLAEESGRG